MLIFTVSTGCFSRLDIFRVYISILTSDLKELLLEDISIYAMNSFITESGKDRTIFSIEDEHFYDEKRFKAVLSVLKEKQVNVSLQGNI